MGNFKRQRTVNGRYGRKPMNCSKCETVSELGDIFYSRVSRRKKPTKNLIKHFCENCYGKQYITV